MEEEQVVVAALLGLVVLYFVIYLAVVNAIKTSRQVDEIKTPGRD